MSSSKRDECLHYVIPGTLRHLQSYVPLHYERPGGHVSAEERGSVLNPGNGVGVCAGVSGWGWGQPASQAIFKCPPLWTDGTAVY